MNILDRFEESIEQIVEGSIGRIMRSPVQPAEIGRKLERSMLSQQIISVGGTMVPNEYRVAMHPADIERFSDYVSSICDDMERWLTDLAGERGLIMVDRTSVQIVPDATVRRRTIHVSATVRARQTQPRPPRTSHTEVFQPRRDPVHSPRLRLASGPGSGEEFSLDRGSLTFGRAGDNDVVLAAADVSRHHARIERNGNRWQVVDLNSTNGTKVNGKPVRRQAIAAGDRITFGSVTAELVAGDRDVT